MVNKLKKKNYRCTSVFIVLSNEWKLRVRRYGQQQKSVNQTQYIYATLKRIYDLMKIPVLLLQYGFM